MANREFNTYFTALDDDIIRQRFRSTLESPAEIDDRFANQWREWLVSFTLYYFSKRPLRTVTDQCRYIAFALRYLAAVEANSTVPNMVQQVLPVMENRPEIIAVLLFGSPEDRRMALRIALDYSSTLEMPQLEPFQETALLAFVQRFEERKTDYGSSFDDSTVAKWSRNLIPELEKAVLEHFRPARRLAQDEAVQKSVVNRPAGTGRSDRAILEALAEQFEQSQQYSYYAFALSALNDYDRRVENEAGYFRDQRRVILAVCLLVLLVVGLLIAPLVFELNEWQLVLREILVFLGGVSTVTLTVLAVVQIRMSAVTATDHISRARSDIQTLQQLIEHTDQ
ncbi:MAG: hypothetical protein JW726_20210 [Anaerolineales bacterium]|nr:hypothetical protein [Anaerolineales bacterium]